MSWGWFRRREKRLRIERACRRLKADDADFTEIDWDNQHITDSDIARLSKSLLAAEKTRNNSSSNNFANTDAQSTNKSCAAHLSLLHLCGNDITPKGASKLLFALRTDKSLSELWMSSNYLGVVGAASVWEMLRWNDTLTWLNLNDTGLGTAGAMHVASGLRDNRTLECLWLNDNRLGDKGASAIADALRYRHGTDDATMMAAAAMTADPAAGKNTRSDGSSSPSSSSISSLRLLSLAENGISEVGAKSLGRMLRSNSSLRILGLYGNVLGDAGASAIASALPHNSSLLELYLGKNGIASRGATAFAYALCCCDTQCALALFVPVRCGGCAAHPGAGVESGVTDAGSGSVCAPSSDDAPGTSHSLSSPSYRRCNSTLLKLWLAQNRVDDEGAAALAVALTSNGTLQEINLGRNDITKRGARALAEALRSSNDVAVAAAATTASAAAAAAAAAVAAVFDECIEGEGMGMDDRGCGNWREAEGREKTGDRAEAATIVVEEADETISRDAECAISASGKVSCLCRRNGNGECRHGPPAGDEGEDVDGAEDVKMDTVAPWRLQRASGGKDEKCGGEILRFDGRRICDDDDCILYCDRENRSGEQGGEAAMAWESSTMSLCWRDYDKDNDDTSLRADTLIQQQTATMNRRQREVVNKARFGTDLRRSRKGDEGDSKSVASIRVGRDFDESDHPPPEEASSCQHKRWDWARQVIKDTEEEIGGYDSLPNEVPAPPPLPSPPSREEAEGKLSYPDMRLQSMPNMRIAGVGMDAGKGEGRRVVKVELP